jgi:hypothetical protein
MNQQPHLDSPDTLAQKLDQADALMALCRANVETFDAMRNDQRGRYLWTASDFTEDARAAVEVALETRSDPAPSA